MTSTLHITLLGQFRLRLDDTPVTTVNTPRLQALLAYLVLRRGVSQSRQHLAFLLSSDSTDSQARTNLRTLVHRLRAALPDIDAFGGDALGIWWQSQIPCTVDVTEFEGALGIAERAEHAENADAALAALQRAAALYQGELLPDCYSEWILPERERLQRRALQALARLVEQLEQRRAYPAAIDYASRALRLDPLKEATYLSLMRLHALHGDRGAVLRTYHACVTTLREELGAEPDLPLREAYERVLAADQPQVAPTREHARGRLIGRTTEWARSTAIWQAAASGHPRLLTLVGDAGIGKTRMAEELLTWAARQGISTATARCYAAEGELPYAPIMAWLRADALRTRLDRLDTIWLTELARLVPEFLERRPEISMPGPVTEQWQRQRLFEALVRAILAETRPLVLLIDDLQWSDQDTLEWLHFLLRAAPQALVLIVGTIRAEELAVNRPLVTLLDTLQRSGQHSSLTLGPLTADETGALANEVAGQTLAAPAASILYRETEGNPLFVIETIRAGLMQVGQDRGSNKLPPPLPAQVQGVIAHRLHQLTPAAHDLVGVAAVIGRSFSFGVLARASGSDEELLVRALDELWQRRIVHEHDADSYDFSHDKLRAVAYDQLSLARRRMLHRRVAEALQTEYAPNADAVSGQIAAHFERAGAVVQATASYQRAAEVAQRVYANAEAVAYLRRAVAVQGSGHVDPGGAAHLGHLNERLGDLLHLTGQYDEGRQAYAAALAVVGAEQQSERARLQRKIGNCWREQYRYDEALAAYGQAEEALSAEAGNSEEQWPARIQIQLDRLQAYYWLGQAAAMFRLIAASQPTVEQHGSPAQRARMYQMLALASTRRDRYVTSDETLGYDHAYRRLIEEAGDPAALPSAQFGTGLALLWHDDLDAAEEPLRAALAAAERTGDVSLEARCLTYLAVLYRKRGNLDLVRSYAERGLRVATTCKMPDYIGAAHGHLAWLAWRVGNPEVARTHGLAALTTWQATALVFGSQWTARWPLISVALAENNLAAAITEARALLDTHQQRPPASLEPVLEAAVAAADRGEALVARSLLERALAPARDLGFL